MCCRFIRTGNWWQKEKPTKILYFSSTISEQELFFISSILQGNPLHILLLLPIDLFTTSNSQFAVTRSANERHH
jgi:hypothetical protein